MKIRFCLIVMGLLACGCSSEHLRVSVSDEVLQSSYLGNGVEWDPYDEAPSWGAEVTEADWLKVIQTNLTGVFHCLKYELLQMNKQGGGAIVNTASIGGLKMTPGFGAYGPSKAGVIAITQTAAVENAKAGIRVNVICPGPTDGTNLMADSKASGAQDTEFLINNVIPLGKLGTTDDIADSVAFLCSRMAGHITGCVLPVCGGMQM